MAKYTKKPVTVEAIQWDNTDVKSRTVVLEWLMTKNAPFTFKEGLLLINTLEGEMTVSHLDFVIEGIQGEFYPCKPDIFESCYIKEP